MAWQHLTLPVVLVAAGMVTAGMAGAGTIDVAPAQPLQAAIDAANPGDTIHLQPGRFMGGITITKSLTVEGSEGTVIDSQGQGSVVTIDAPEVTIRTLTVTGSGTDLAAPNAGIFLSRNSRKAMVEINHEAEQAQPA